MGKQRALFGLILILAGLALIGASEARAQTFQPTCTDTSRQCMIGAAQSYLQALVHHDGSKVPFAPQVRFTELAKGGAVTGEAKMRDGIAHQVPLVGLGNIRFFTDEKKHQVIALALLRVNWDEQTAAKYRRPPGPFTVHLMERFRVEHGLITEIENFFFNEEGTSDGTSAWSDD